MARVASGLDTQPIIDPSSGRELCVTEVELCDTDDPSLDVFIAEKYIANNSDVVSSLSSAM